MSIDILLAHKDRSLILVEFEDSESNTRNLVLLCPPNAQPSDWNQRLNILIKSSQPLPIDTHDFKTKSYEAGFRFYDGKDQNGAIIPAIRQYDLQTNALVCIIHSQAKVQLDTEDGTPCYQCFDKNTGILLAAESRTNPNPKDMRDENWRQLSSAELEELTEKKGYPKPRPHIPDITPS